MHGSNSKSSIARKRLLFPKSRRLPSSSSFQSVFSNGVEIAGRAMVVWVSRKADCERRMGVIATKRTFKNAVDRNRAKRLIRESFRLLQDKFSKEPWDMVILARRRILSMKQQDVQREMRSICRRHGIYSDTIS